MSRIILQINATANWGSTGKIVEQINNLAREQGWKTYIAFGRYSKSSQSKLIHVGNTFQVYEHYVEHLLWDNDGLASRLSTKQLINKIDDIKPDIIHLHNIHDHWLNYRILFEYLNTLDIPIIWTQHDCWSFTGGCKYFNVLECDMWKNECTYICPFRAKSYISSLINRTRKHYILKKKLFSATKNLTLVSVSHWLEGVLRHSFFKNRPIYTIHNGVDISIFKPIDNVKQTLEKYKIDDIKYVVGVATSWTERKGFTDYCKLSSLLPEGIKIVLVGLNDSLLHKAEESGIIGIPRTENVEELVAIYNGAFIVMNLSYEETFGLTTVEGLACGTPGIVYNCTASPELVTPETGVVVEPGDIQGVANAACEIFKKGKMSYSYACRLRAETLFDKDKRYQDYIRLYNNLISLNRFL